MVVVVVVLVLVLVLDGCLPVQGRGGETRPLSLSAK